VADFLVLAAGQRGQGQSGEQGRNEAGAGDRQTNHARLGSGGGTGVPRVIIAVRAAALRQDSGQAAWPGGGAPTGSAQRGWVSTCSVAETIGGGNANRAGGIPGRGNRPLTPGRAKCLREGEAPAEPR